MNQACNIGRHNTYLKSDGAVENMLTALVLMSLLAGPMGIVTSPDGGGRKKELKSK